MAAINQICAQNLQGSTDSPQIFEKTVQSAGRTESSAPTNSVGNFELYQASREKSRKTEAVFLVGSRGFRGEIEIPPVLKLQTSEAFSFGEAKENAERQLLISKRVLTLTGASLSTEMVRIHCKFRKNKLIPAFKRPGAGQLPAPGWVLSVCIYRQARP